MQQADRQAIEIVSARNRDGDGLAAGDDLEVEELDLQRDGPPPIACALAMAPDFVNERLEFRDHDIEAGDVA